MKLSQISSEKAADILIRIAPDIETIVNDKELVAMVSKREKVDIKDDNSKQKATKVGGLFILKTAAYLLKNHRECAWNIIGALNDKTSEEIANQPIIVTFTQTTEILSDRDFMTFFQ